MAFRKKFHGLVDLNPDLLIIQEAEHKEKLVEALKEVKYNQIYWYGLNKNKGIAVISFNEINIELNPLFNPEFEYIIPMILTVKSEKINLFCIWAMPHKTNRSKRYIGQVFCAINYYSNLLEEKSVLIGDFNSNAIWDKKKRIGSHTDVVNILKNHKIQSLYHAQYKLEHGNESHPTFYLLKKEDKPFHIDYCFASNQLTNSKTKLIVGTFDDWITLSDHMPIIIDNLLLS